MLEQRRWQVHPDSQTGCPDLMRWMYGIQFSLVAQRVCGGSRRRSPRAPIGVGDDECVVGFRLLAGISGGRSSVHPLRWRFWYAHRPNAASPTSPTAT